MSYNFITQYDSPNYTEGNNGRKYIIIHWWDDPSKNPTFEGVIATLCNPSRGASAHFIATGTGRRVACLVNLDDTAWHAGTSNPATNPNPISIGIECDPRCRDEDYDVVAELIANIRSAYGDLPLKRHSDFVATTCPGNWDLARLDALARKKDGSGDWGVVTDIVQAPVITTGTVTVTQDIAFDAVTQNDATLPVGQSKIMTAGVKGVRTIVYTVTYTNGKETARVIKSDTVTTKPVAQVTAIGTYVEPVADPTTTTTDPIVPSEDASFVTWLKNLFINLAKWLLSWRNK